MYRSRPFRGHKYPWDSPEKDIAEANRLIQKHGYWRRKAELDNVELTLSSSSSVSSQSPNVSTATVRTILGLEFVGYSQQAKQLEQYQGVGAVAEFGKSIQKLLDDGLKMVDAARDKTVLATTGDGALLAFESALSAHDFATAIHTRCTKFDSAVPEEVRMKNAFRMGAATGEIVLEPKPGGGFAFYGLSPVTSKPASRGHFKTGHSEVRGS